jgi:hypothetical protein
MAEIETHKIIWPGRKVEISFDPNWLGGTAQHLELRSDQALPVTETGYRSRFLPSDTIAKASDLLTFVHAWLDTASQDKGWKAKEERDRQGDLFDL